jgi:hypothetical protein
MSAQTGWMLIALGTALAVVGATMVNASVARFPQNPARLARARRHDQAGTPTRGLPGALVSTSLLGGVLTGVQWVVLSKTGPAALWVAVLGLPAFLAGATVIRLIAVLRAAYRRHRHARRLQRVREWAR